jgi:hypothetical protein
MARFIIWTLGLALAANGLVMLAVPAPWYGFVPGVADTGPLNLHFIRDIGAAYLVAGGGVIAFLRAPRARPAALAAAAFLTLHALVHLGEAAAGRESLLQLARDVPLVIVQGPLLFLLLRRRPLSQKETRYAEMADAAADRRV